MAKIDTLFMSKTAEKPYPLGPHIPTVPPETIDPFTEVLPRPIRRSIPRSRLGNDAACQNFTEVLPGFAAT